LILFVLIQFADAAKVELTDTPEKSQQALTQINQIRQQYGRPIITFDLRVFHLAKARLDDMRRYTYYDHTNPETGTCADSLKAQFGFGATEYVAENIVGYDQPTINTQYYIAAPDMAIASWMGSRGHRFNLLYANHTAGAIVCQLDKCIFLGLNGDRFGERCYFAKEGREHWKNAPLQPGEI
jgi:uncharacterized protein YkwD